MSRPTFQSQQTRQEAEALRREGYMLDVTSRGYQVWFGADYVCGAGILPTAKGPRGGQAAIKQVDDYLATAVIRAARHRTGRLIAKTPAQARLREMMTDYLNMELAYAGEGSPVKPFDPGTVLDVVMPRALSTAVAASVDAKNDMAVLDALFLVIQRHIGQTDGGVAGVFTSGCEEDLAGLIRTIGDIRSATRDGLALSGGFVDDTPAMATTIPDDAKLAEDILSFLSTYAGTAGDYDPTYDGPGDRFTGPDASMLWCAAQALLQGMEPMPVLSSYGSGCYDWPNKAGEAEHDRLITALRQRPKPEPRAGFGAR